MEKGKIRLDMIRFLENKSNRIVLIQPSQPKFKNYFNFRGTDLGVENKKDEFCIVGILNDENKLVACSSELNYTELIGSFSIQINDSYFIRCLNNFIGLPETSISDFFIGKNLNPEISLKFQILHNTKIGDENINEYILTEPI